MATATTRWLLTDGVGVAQSGVRGGEAASCSGWRRGHASGLTRISAPSSEVGLAARAAASAADPPARARCGRGAERPRGGAAHVEGTGVKPPRIGPRDRLRVESAGRHQGAGQRQGQLGVVGGLPREGVPVAPIHEGADAAWEGALHLGRRGELDPRAQVVPRELAQPAPPRAVEHAVVGKPILDRGDEIGRLHGIARAHRGGPVPACEGGREGGVPDEETAARFGGALLAVGDRRAVPIEDHATNGTHEGVTRGEVMGLGPPQARGRLPLAARHQRHAVGEADHGPVPRGTHKAGVRPRPPVGGLAHEDRVLGTDAVGPDPLHRHPIAGQGPAALRPGHEVFPALGSAVREDDAEDRLSAREERDGHARAPAAALHGRGPVVGVHHPHGLPRTKDAGLLAPEGPVGRRGDEPRADQRFGFVVGGALGDGPPGAIGPEELRPEERARLSCGGDRGLERSL